MLLTYAPLLLTVVLLQLSSGAAAPLDALSGITLGFSTTQIGLLGSAHFVGFFIGCWWAPRLTGRVGHSRAFAAFAAAGGIGLLAHMMWLDPYAWAVMRVATGLCISGCYTIIEAWLNGRLTNENRGKAMGAYRLVDLGAVLAGQSLIGVLEPAAYVSYNLLAIFCCASLLPLALTELKPPATSRALRLRPRLAAERSPLAVLAVVVSGVSGAAFRMVGPVYGEEQGLSPDQLALFLAVFVLGGAAAQYPAGWLADRVDRRRALIVLSILALSASLVTVWSAQYGGTALICAIAAFGFAVYPVFSVAAAHAHDFAADDERVELTAALLFFYALGAMGSPLLVAALIGPFGPDVLFWFVGGAHIVLIVYGLIRMQARPTAAERTAYVYTPRTTFTLGRLLKKMRDGD